MEISFFIIIILCLYTAIGILDQISIQLGPFTPLFAATFTGLIMGDIQTGLLIGATLQLMTLGVATFGGASVPDFLSGAVIGTAYSIMAGEGFEFGIGVAIPVGLLLTQLDVLGRMANTFFHKKAKYHAQQGDDKGVELSNILGIFSWTSSRMIPVFIGLFFGEQVIQLINYIIPIWLMNGLRASGAILPAMGIAILMRYLPIRKFWPYFLGGFVLYTFVKGFTILGVALAGVVAAALHVSRIKSTPVLTSGIIYQDDDEVEIDE